MLKNNSTYQYPRKKGPIQIHLGCFFWVGLIMGVYGLNALRTAVDIVSEKNQLAYQNKTLLKEKEHLEDFARVEFQLGELEGKIAQLSNSDMKCVLNQEKKQIILNHHQCWKCFCYQKQFNRTKGE